MNSGPNNEHYVLVTGAAGFIGFHLTQRLLELGMTVHGLDNLTPYYDPQLKQDRLSQLQQHPRFRHAHIDLADRDSMRSYFDQAPAWEAVVHLAAQAGVRYSLEHPMAYLDSNLAGTMHLLEGCRHGSVKHLLYASSSSVYGASATMPLREDQATDQPVSLYAATKKSCEVLVHSYSHLYRVPATGLRLFTVYGPWGRPDMAIFKFTHAILAGEPIEVYNHGKMQRDFTYVADVVEAIRRLIPLPPTDETGTVPHRILNVGNNSPVQLEYFINCIENSVGIPAIKQHKPMHKGDVPATWADVSRLKALTGFEPGTSIELGVEHFVNWYQDYYSSKRYNGILWMRGYTNPKS
ncbi:NAD-dependent epimerase/dehydratase family protein [Noviherbaspirillum malthae]|uniref:NAD-dependent epimerase/dehydratase family protein n=1 Tax=Noviherbaspirillum malthae TaxID=1260987 RepID=UPI0018903B5B|nr:NAD-dependent epimerase/dehydratase family protein [Noviherbaspirillum malthae]